MLSIVSILICLSIYLKYLLRRLLDSDADECSRTLLDFSFSEVKLEHENRPRTSESIIFTLLSLYFDK